MQGVHPDQVNDHEDYYVERTWVSSAGVEPFAPEVPPTLEEYRAKFGRRAIPGYWLDPHTIWLREQRERTAS